MKRKLLFGLFIITAFVGSFLLANHLSDNKVSLNTQFNKIIHRIELLLTDEPEINVVKTESKQIFVKSKQQYQHVEVGDTIACKDTSLGEIKYKKTGDVYTWIDERGIANFGDTPPKNGDFKLLNYAGEKVFDYFSLDLNTENLPYDFNQKLTAKLNMLFEVYGQLLDISSLKKVDINLRVFASKEAFNQLKIKHNVSISDNTPGFYSHATNQAYLLFTSVDATMRTATHEATHAINRGIIGYSPKWLNEGLAEYSEYIEVNGKYGQVYPNKDWTHNNLVSEKLLPLSALMTATNEDWDSNIRKRLYATSWAFVYFMMDNQHRKIMLAKVIKNEQINLCNVTKQQQIEKIIGLPVNRLQKQFINWARLKLIDNTPKIASGGS